MADEIQSELTNEIPAMLGDLIGAVGRGVADAQHALDVAAMDQLTAIATAEGAVADTLRAIGYQPTWYRIPELNAEITVSLTLAGRSEQSGRTRMQLYATPVDASYSNKYVVNADVTSRITFKVVPVPPSPLAADLRVVPELTGQTFADAEALLVAQGIPFRRVVRPSPGTTSTELQAGADSDKVIGTTPAGREVLRPGDAVVVETARPNREGDA